MKDFRNVIFVLIIILFLGEMIITKKENEKVVNEINSTKPIVSVSTFSLYDIVNHIGQDDINLVMILPFGVDAHSFEPTPKLMMKIYKSDLVIYNGAGLEPWIKGIEFKKRVINMSKYVKLRELSHHSKHHQNHHESNIDPHYWLDIENMIVATDKITTILSDITPRKRSFYEKNAQEYKNMLKSLDIEYKKSLSQCKHTTIIVNHNAFSYISKKYNFDVEALSGLSPESEPSAKNMLRLIEHIKEHNASTIFFESFVSDKAIKSIATEMNVAVDVLQPLGNITADEAKRGMSYEDIMKLNLQKISKALLCN